MTSEWDTKCRDAVTNIQPRFKGISSGILSNGNPGKQWIRFPSILPKQIETQETYVSPTIAL